MVIDLHTHSTASDGTVAPADLIKQAARAKLDIIALTDHDTTAGWEPAIAALPPGLTLVPGAELSCVWNPTKGRPISLHILAYLYDPEEPRLAEAMQRVRESRFQRGELIVQQLIADGVGISWDEVLAVANGAPIGRPHIAQVLVRHGVVPTIDVAFHPQWLGERYRMTKVEIDVFTALEMVADAGGVTVLAHPKAVIRGRIIPDDLIGDLADAGLVGLECDHHDHTQATRKRLHQLAAEHGLVPTGSSDYHGAAKTQPLAEYTTSEDSYHRLVGQATRRAPISR